MAQQEDPFEHIVPFVLTAEALSFREAAARLGVHPSTVSRAVAALEERLGVALFLRTSRVVTLTDEGRLLLASSRLALEELEGTRQRLRAHLERPPEGLLRVSLPHGLGRKVVLPALGAWLDQFPGLRLRASLTDRWVDMAAEQVDVALRIGQLPDSELVARRLAESHFVTAAAPSYLERWGHPRRPSELADEHRCLTYVRPGGLERRWRFRDPRTRSASWWTFEPLGYMALDHGESLVDAACQGLGIVHVPDYLISAEVEAGRVVELFEGWGDHAGTIHAVYHRSRRHLPRVRAFVAWAEELCLVGPSRDDAATLEDGQYR